MPVGVITAGPSIIAGFAISSAIDTDDAALLLARDLVEDGVKVIRGRDRRWQAAWRAIRRTVALMRPCYACGF